MMCVFSESQKVIAWSSSHAKSIEAVLIYTCWEFGPVCFNDAKSSPEIIQIEKAYSGSLCVYVINTAITEVYLP